MRRYNYLKLFIQDYKDTRNLVHKCIGVLLTYYVICNLITQFGIFRLCSMVWGYALQMMPEQYISDANIKGVFTHPLLLIIALLEVFIFCTVCIWQNAGLFMILEGYRQGKPVKLLSVLYKSFEQIKHVAKPKNWPMFLLVVIILPITDAKMSSSALPEIVIPEFISDFIYARLYLTVLLLIVTLLALYFYHRYSFVQQSFVLEQKSFKESARTSIAVGKKNRIYLGISQILVSGFSSIIYIVMPVVIIGICELIVNIVMSNYKYVLQITEWVLSEFGREAVIELGSGYVKMHVMAFALVVFHSTCDREQVKTDIRLVNGIEKTSGKIRPLKLWIIASHILIYTIIIGLTVLITLRCEEQPEFLANLTSNMKIAAHKGYSSKAPENTLDAFELACQSDSADMIELDVRETKDGIPVVIHNENIWEATGVNESVYDINLSELQKLKACYKFANEYPDAYIPTLDEVLDKYANKIDFLIEIKYSDRTPDLPVKIAKLMEKYGITETSIIHSGSYEALSKVKEYNPNIKCGLIMAFCSGGYYDLENADFFSLEHDFVNDASMDSAHSRGKKVFAWTVNEEQSMAAMRVTDVDMVITDYPDKCHEIMLRGNDIVKDALAGIEYNLDFSKFLSPLDYDEESAAVREDY